jgi:flagellar hook-associated protein 1
MSVNLLSLLQNSSASLAAQQAATAVVSHNLDNSATAGYARQTANIETTLPADFVGNAYIGTGARLATVSQSRDRFLERQIPASLGSAAQYAAESQALSSIDALDPSADGGLASALSSFYSALRALSQNPGNTSLRTAAVGAAGALATAFNQASSAVEAARSGLDTQLSGLLPQVNQLAASVADLNGQIRLARASGAEPNDLLDTRQRALDQLYTLTGATPIQNANGDVDLALGRGAPLVTGDFAGQLSAVADPANGGHLGLRLTVPAGSTLQPLASGAVGGTIGGALEARDGALLTAASQIDSLAFDLAGTVNTVHAAGYGLDGVNGRSLFDVSATAQGAAASLALSAAVAADPRALAAASAAGVPGDNTNLLSLIGTESQALTTSGLDPGNTLSSITSQFGAAAQRAQALSEQDAAIQDHLQSLRQSTSGVSVDEELVLMQKAQRAYEAIAKVIQTASDMFDTLMQLK